MTQATTLFGTDEIAPGSFPGPPTGPEGARCGDCHHCVAVQYLRSGRDVDHYACALVLDGHMKARSNRRRLRDRPCAVWRWRDGELRVRVRGQY